MRKGGVMNDQINSPKHYNNGKIEVIDFIEDQQMDLTLAMPSNILPGIGLRGDPLKT